MKYLSSIFLSSLLLLLTLSGAVSAQNEIERERISLQGLQEFGFTANIQGSRTLTDDPVLTPTVIRQDAVTKLVTADLRYVSDEEVRSSADLPFLYMHINTLELANGLIPFSIQLRLYQPVTLPFNRNLQTSASTWETGMVGIVSHDQIPLIREAAAELVEEFIQDYRLANSRR